MKIAIDSPYEVSYMTSIESSIVDVAVLEIVDAELLIAYLSHYGKNVSYPNSPIPWGIWMSI